MTNTELEKNLMEARKNTLKEEIKEKKEEIEEKKQELKGLEDDDDYDAYDEWLDDIDGDVKIGTLTYSASYVLKNVDEIAYNCGYNDYIDFKTRELNDEISTLEDEIKELETELKELEEEKGGD